MDIAGRSFVPLSFPTSLFPLLGPLATRRGDRIISEAFARLLPPSSIVASSSLSRPGRGESLIIVTGHGASSLTYSVPPLRSFRFHLLHPVPQPVPLARSILLSVSLFRTPCIPGSSSLTVFSACSRCPLYNTLCPSAF